MLYTPFLPEAASGTLEPRHVVTPLRDILRRTNLRLGAVTGHDPAARTIELESHEGEVEQLRYDQLLLALGSVSRLLPVPGLDRHAIGFKSLADAIWLRNHVIETLERANATEDRDLRDELLTYVFVGGGYAGLEALAELQDFAADAMDALPARSPARDALDPGRGLGPRAARDRPRPGRTTPLNELRGRGHRHPTRHPPRGGRRATSASLSTGETIPTRTCVWTTGVAPHPSLRKLSVPLDETGRVPVDAFLRVDGHGFASGRSATAPRPPIPRPRRPGCAADGAARRPPGPGRRAQHRRRARRRHARRPSRTRRMASFVNLGRYKAVGSLGRFKFRGFPAWLLARTYHLSQIPGIPRKIRAAVDWTVGLPFSRDVSEVGSIGHPRPLREEVYERGGSHRPVP